jgi:hypothetical protein
MKSGKITSFASNTAIFVMALIGCTLYFSAIADAFGVTYTGIDSESFNLTTQMDTMEYNAAQFSYLLNPANLFIDPYMYIVSFAVSPISLLFGFMNIATSSISAIIGVIAASPLATNFLTIIFTTITIVISIKHFGKPMVDTLFGGNL